MKQKRLISMIALLMAALFLFAACGGGETPTVPEDGDQNAGGNNATPDNGNGKNEPQAPALKLGGVDVSKFSIVYETAKEKSLMGAYWRDEYDSGKVTAERLAALIEAKFNIKLNVYADVSHAAEANEILIGNTNRAESKSTAVKALTDDQYIVSMDGGKLVICGGAPGTTYHAVDSIEAYLGTTVANDQYAIDESGALSGSYHLQRIAILGDSISYGALATDYQNNNGRFGYAAQTGRMYWQECLVTSYAKPGICLRRDLNGFVTNALWTGFRADMKQNKFDIVLIMLGVNDGYTDAKTGDTWDGVWTDQDDKSFLKDLKFMIQTVHMDNKEAEVVVMNCPVYYRSGDQNSPYYHASHYHSSPRIIALQAQAVTELREGGAEYVHLYDMNSYSKQNTTAAMFPDLLHPADKGHEIMAKGVVAMLKLLREGQTDQYLVN